MYKIINFDEFRDSFNSSDACKNNFSYEGLKTLFDYFEDTYDDIKDRDGNGIGFEFDMVAICCDYTEYPTAMEAAKSYNYEEGVDLEPHGSLDLLEVDQLEEKQAREWLEERTQVINFEGGIIILNF